MRRSLHRVIAAVVAGAVALAGSVTVSASPGEGAAGSGPTLAQQAPTDESPGQRPPEAGPPDRDPDDGAEGWRAEATGIGGIGRYGTGEWVYQDFVYDDEEEADNAADVVELRVRPDGDDLLLRVILNTLRAEDATVVGVAIADGDGEPADWPFDAGVRSPWEQFVTVVPNDGVALWSTGEGDPAPLAAPEVDHDANTVEVRLPEAAMDDPVLRLNGGVGLWDGEGWSEDPGVVDLAFNRRGLEPVGNNFRSEAQSDAIDDGDVTAFHHDVDVGELREGRTDPQVTEPGLYNAVFESRQNLGEGYGDDFPAHRGLYQPYALWIPEGVDLTEPTPLVLVLHSLGSIHNQYNTWSVYPELGDGLGAVAITPLALGTDGWYWDEALVDTLDAWIDVTGRFNIDADRVSSTGYSMGGYGTYRLGTLLPELLTAGVSWVGPPVAGIWLGTDVAQGPDNTHYQLENTNHVPFFIIHGTNDELVPVTGVTRQAERFRELGHEYRYALHPGQDHLSFAIIDDWSRERVWLRGRERVTDPPHVTFKVRPHTWVTDGHSRQAEIRSDLTATVAELGAELDSAYWVRNVATAGEGDVTGFVDLTSHGVAHRIPELTEELAVVVPGSSPHLLRGQTRQYLWEERENRLSGSLTEVEELTVDLAWANLSLEGLELDIEVDRPVTLHLVDGEERRTVTLE